MQYLNTHKLKTLPRTPLYKKSGDSSLGGYCANKRIPATPFHSPQHHSLPSHKQNEPFIATPHPLLFILKWQTLRSTTKTPETTGKALTLTSMECWVASHISRKSTFRDPRTSWLSLVWVARGRQRWRERWIVVLGKFFLLQGLATFARVDVICICCFQRTCNLAHFSLNHQHLQTLFLFYIHCHIYRRPTLDQMRAQQQILPCMSTLKRIRQRL